MMRVYCARCTISQSPPSDLATRRALRPTFSFLFFLFLPLLLLRFYLYSYFIKPLSFLFKVLSRNPIALTIGSFIDAFRTSYLIYFYFVQLRTYVRLPLCTCRFFPPLTFSFHRTLFIFFSARGTRNMCVGTV